MGTRAKSPVNEAWGDAQMAEVVAELVKVDGASFPDSRGHFWRVEHVSGRRFVVLDTSHGKFTLTVERAP